VIGRAGLVLLLAAALVAPLRGQRPDRWNEAVLKALQRADSLAVRRGYQPTPVRLTGSLFIDEAEGRDLPIGQAGNYLIVGTCDEDCRVLNLVLSNPNGDEIAVDRGERNSPLIETASTRSGTYRLKVIMLGCRRAPCRYGVALYRKR
jgi:hypothetical protein